MPRSTPVPEKAKPPRARRRAASAPEGLERGRVHAALFGTLRTIWHFERMLAGRFGVGYQEIYLLQLLRRTPCMRVGTIAAGLELPWFSATRLVQRLAREGLVAKEADPGDRRVALVSLLPRGEELIAAIEERTWELVSEASGELPAEGLDAYFLVASDLHRLLGVSLDPGTARPGQGELPAVTGPSAEAERDGTSGAAPARKRRA